MIIAVVEAIYAFVTFVTLRVLKVSSKAEGVIVQIMEVFKFPDSQDFRSLESEKR